MPRWNSTVLERVLAKIEIQPNGCWLWTGCVTWAGYGRMKVNRKPEMAHRVSYFAHGRALPPGMPYLDHACHDPATCKDGNLCQHRRCVNPDHLVPSNRQLNNCRERSNAGDIHRRQTHCIKGHPFDTANTMLIVTAKGLRKRFCRVCNNANRRRRRLERLQEVAPVSAASVLIET